MMRVEGFEVTEVQSVKVRCLECGLEAVHSPPEAGISALTWATQHYRNHHDPARPRAAATTEVLP